jgi:DNA primase
MLSLPLEPLTPDQIRLINRLTKTLPFFDGDVAGLRASIRGIDLILKRVEWNWVLFLMEKIR